MNETKTDRSLVRALDGVMHLERERAKQERAALHAEALLEEHERGAARRSRRSRARQRLTRIKRRRRWAALRKQALDRVEQLRIVEGRIAAEEAQASRLLRSEKKIRGEYRSARLRHSLRWGISLCMPLGLAALVGLAVSHGAVTSGAGIEAGVHHVSDTDVRLAALRRGLLAMDADIDAMSDDYAALQRLRASAVDEAVPEETDRPKPRKPAARRTAAKKTNKQPKPSPKKKRLPIVIDWDDTAPLGGPSVVGDRGLPG